jgi:haloacetate dehalogenase
LVLLHGFPETGVMWHQIAPELAKQFTLVIPDLRGYGWSSAPASRDGAAYTKRAMGTDVVAVMEELGHVRFAFAGHDRGARVGYRLALDHPGRITRLALLDIVPTMEVWRSIEGGSGKSPHWLFLAEPEPKPEQVIAQDPNGYYADLMRLWSKSKTLDGFDARALAHYRAGWGDRSRIHASCEDYRAGAAQDRQADEEDETTGKAVACPVHVLASSDYLGNPGSETPLQIWQRTFAPQASGTTVNSGHFIAEENPEATLAALQGFLVS